MKIEVTFENGHERERILSSVSFTLNYPTLDLAVVEEALVKNLEDVVMSNFVQGNLKRLQIENQDAMVDEAKKFFKRDKAVEVAPGLNVEDKETKKDGSETVIPESEIAASN